jgi:hypothetical protein
VSGDYSRYNFDPRSYFSSVLMQQGRVALDSDWNEFSALIDRRLRAETVDIIGRAVVPKETADGFKITPAAVSGKNTLTIGRGRIYVHGLLAENFGLAPWSFDLDRINADGKPVGVLAELIGSDTMAFDQQPFLSGDGTLPQAAGPHLVYLDVWQREVTAIEDGRLLEPALGGVDTTTRLQTVWQVKVLPDAGNITCATPDGDIKGWPDTIQPSAGRLSTEALLVADPDDPCLLPPTPGYRGLENQLYRVEIHDAGSPGTATFKWSRDHASVSTNIVEMPAADTLIVASVGRDAVLRVSPGHWVEITDDRREFAGLPGDMRKVVHVDDATRRITLAGGVSADLVNGANGLKARHARLRRWDHKGSVRDVNGVELADLDAAGSNGTIPVPADGAAIVLESGCQITFSVDPAGGKLRSGDYWSFAARTADASVEHLDKAPPRGIHHHYCRLAVVTFPGTAIDCRTLWPPAFGGHDCACTVCVTAEQHNNGTLTIQQAIQTAKATGGTVCLGAGLFNLGITPVVVDAAQSVRIVGQGVNTVLWYVGNGAAVTISHSLAITTQDFAVKMPPPQKWSPTSGFGGGPGFLIRHAAGVTVQRCAVLQIGIGEPSDAAIRLDGVLLGVTVADNAVFGFRGIAGPDPDDESKDSYLLSLDLTVRDNLLACADRGISLEGISLNLGKTALTGNTLFGCREFAIVTAGAVAAGGMEIAGNMLYPTGNGIVIGTNATRIDSNTIVGLPGTGDHRQHGDGIALFEGLDPLGVQDCRIISNHVAEMGGNGIAVPGRIRSAMIKQNIVRRCGGGIVMDAKSKAETVTIDNNQLSDIVPTLEKVNQPISAIRAIRVDHLHIGDNVIRGLARNAVSRSDGLDTIIGIDVIGCRGSMVAGNDLDEIGADSSLIPTFAIRIHPPFSSVQVSGNVARRSPVDLPPRSFWSALWIGSAKEMPDAGGGGGLLAGAALRQAGGTDKRQNQTEVQTGFDALGPGAAAWKGAMSPIRNLTILGTESALFLLDPFAVSAAPAAPRAHLGVQGNHFFGAGGLAPMVFVEWPDACNFANNQCHVEVEIADPAVVYIAAPNVAVIGNVVRRSQRSDAYAMRIWAASESFTVLGNITSAQISVNGSSLPPPWLHLNVLAY